MRTHLFWTTALTLGLLVTLAGPAFAQPPGQAPDGAEREQRMAALHAARNASFASFKENRTAAIEEYRAAHNATRASFLENKTRVLDECAALRNESAEANATSGCVRDGLKPLIAQARADHKAQKDALHAALLEARTNAKAIFQAARAQQRANSG